MRALPLTDSIASTRSRSRNVTLWRRSRYWNASPISPSRKPSVRSRWSTTVTFVPSAPNIEAYSTPITPAPTTVIECGTRRSSLSRPSESMIVRSSKATVSGRAGRVPTAMTIRSARIGSSWPAIVIVWSSWKQASPCSQPTMLRRNCSRTTVVSAATTRAARSMSCWSAWRSVSSIRVGSRMSSGRSASWSSTASRSVLDGIVPVWIDTPPSRSRRSATATRLPSFAAWMAAFWPEGPEPMTSRSSSTVCILPGRRTCDALPCAPHARRRGQAGLVGRRAPVRGVAAVGRRARVRGGRGAPPVGHRRGGGDLGGDRARGAPAGAAGAAGGDRGAAGRQRDGAGTALPDLRRPAARAGDPDRADPAHVLRHERSHPLPQRAPDAADAARLAGGAGDQRERHDDHRRDLLWRQRLPRGAGRGPARRGAVVAAHGHGGAVYGENAGGSGGAAGRAGRRSRGARRVVDRPRGLAARVGRDALEGRGGGDGDGGGDRHGHRLRTRAGRAGARVGGRAGGHPVRAPGGAPLELQAVAEVREADGGDAAGRHGGGE